MDRECFGYYSVRQTICYIWSIYSFMDVLAGWLVGEIIIKAPRRHRGATKLLCYWKKKVMSQLNRSHNRFFGNSKQGLFRKGLEVGQVTEKLKGKVNMQSQVNP